ncbi:hypothetical protein Y032_0119g814 [Ancylostoma ceylanicum]|uniref:Uncharacterized protein n=1 Tax=Ancylostoma ceylanicum TaxID=53326 RepID=A0A016TB14_9BILA|nr:hypothetical protein Y032_0119g814 [Ancylostoma ceylanicum]
MKVDFFSFDAREHWKNCSDIIDYIRDQSACGWYLKSIWKCQRRWPSAASKSTRGDRAAYDGTRRHCNKFAIS